MRRRATIVSRTLALIGLGLAITAPAFGAGFGIFEQGARSMGMAGAFTAQADDPSAMWHNAAGLAFQEERDFMVGFTWIRSLTSDFEGADPFPGVGVREDLETLSEFPPHLYWVEPLSQSWTFGLGVMSPFGLVTEWENKDTFPGRFINTKAGLKVFDINPTLAVKLSPNFSVGFGAVARLSEVELNQNVPFFDPFNQRIADIGRVRLTSDLDDGFGFNVGLLHKPSNSFSWGLSYRSEVDVDYGGEAVLTQIATGNPQLDGVIAATLPFGRDLPVETGIDFPQMASLGVAIHLGPQTVLEADVNWTGWSSFDVLDVNFVNDDLPDDEVLERWDDAYNYRLGIAFGPPDGKQLRFGFVFDETPQPEEAVSPLLPDGDRVGVTIGYGWVGNKTTLDLALMYLQMDDPERFKSFPGEGDFFGTYENEAILLGVSLGF